MNKWLSGVLFPTLRLFSAHTAWGYLQSIVLVAVVAGISIILHWLKPANMVMLYLAVVVYAGLFSGRGPALLASLLSVLAFDFLQVDPRLTLTVADPEDLLTFFGLALVGLVISTYANRLNVQVHILRSRQTHLSALNALSHDLARAISLQDILFSVVSNIQVVFHRPSAILLPGEAGLQVAAAATGGALSTTALQNAQSLYEQWQATQLPLPSSNDDECWPLQASQGIMGMLCLPRGDLAAGEPLLSREQRTQLKGFVNLAALAIERFRLAEKASQAIIFENTERLQTALLHSISHELRTPLVSITGALSTLAEEPPHAAINESHRELIDTAYEEAQRLNMLVGNLLDMTRLEAGAIRLALEPCDLQDLVGITLSRFSERHNKHEVQLFLADDLPLVRVDVALMVQVLLNLLDNAAKYSPESAPIVISAVVTDSNVQLSVSDSGIGIPEEETAKIFQKFYRSSSSQRIGGLGLGLSICKGIVEAHGGCIWAARSQSGGICVSFTMPVDISSS